MAPLTFATSELDGVNEMLSMIGEAPVNSLDNATGDVAMARSILSRVNRTTQIQGWHWNSEIEHTLTPDSSGRFKVNPDWIRIAHFEGTNSDLILSIERSYVYDMRKRTNVLKEGTLSQLKLNVVIFKDFESQLPESARAFMVARAGRMFHDRVFGTPRHHSYMSEDEQAAWTTLLCEEASFSNANLLNQSMIAGITSRGGGEAAVDTPLPPGLGQGGHPGGDT